MRHLRTALHITAIILLLGFIGLQVQQYRAQKAAQQAYDTRFQVDNEIIAQVYESINNREKGHHASH